MEKLILTQREKFLLIAMVFITLSTVGVFLNVGAISNNGCRMPVYTKGFVANDNSHFTFTGREQVSYFLLTDIIHTYFILEAYHSIGDVLIYAGSIGFFFFMIKFVFYKGK